MISCGGLLEKRVDPHLKIQSSLGLMMLDFACLGIRAPASARVNVVVRLDITCVSAPRPTKPFIVSTSHVSDMRLSRWWRSRVLLTLPKVINLLAFGLPPVNVDD